MDDLTIDIDVAEWETAYRLLRFADPDERSVLGCLALVADGSTRTWSATDARWLAYDATEPDSRDFTVLVSPQLVRFGAATSRDTGSVSLVVEHDGDGLPRQVRVDGGDRSLSVLADRRPFPGVRALVEKTFDEVAPTVVVDAPSLYRVFGGAAIRPAPREEEDERDPDCWVSIDEGTIEVGINWPDVGPSIYRLTGEGSGTAVLPVPPAQIAGAIEGWRGLVEIRGSSEFGVPLAIRSPDHRQARLIMPMKPGVELERPRVEAILSDLFGNDVLYRDGDGDYPLTLQGTPVYARLSGGDPVRLQVFAVVLRDVDSSPELLSELNDHNVATSFTRTFWVAGQVLVEADLVAATLDPEEIITTYERVRSLTDEVGPMLSAIFGGTATALDVDHRWAHYLRTVIRAELSPGQWATLTGPDATHAWPYDDPVHVLTAWNPAGRRRPADANNRSNGELAALLAQDDIGFVRAVGRDPAGDYEEPGFLAWGLDRDQAVAIGRRFDQEAVFELTDPTTHVIGCFDDRVEDRPRRP